MLVYYIAYGLMLLAALKRGKRGYIGNRKQNRFYCLFFSILWICLLGLRHPSMGVDLHYGSAYGYLGRFEYIASASWRTLLGNRISNYEPGYTIFCKLLGYLGTDYQLLLFTCAAISVGSVMWWIYKNSDYPFMSTIIFLGLPFFLINFSGLRQGLAIAVTTISMEFIKNRKPVYFVLLVMLATTLHVSAWSFIFAYPLYHFKIDQKVGIVSILIPLITFLFREPLFVALSKLYNENVRPDNNGAIVLFLTFLVVYFFTVIFSTDKDRDEMGLRNLFLAVCICQSMAGVYSTVMRIAYYYMPALIILLPRIISNKFNADTISRTDGSKKYHDMSVIYLVICVGFLFFGLYLLSRDSWAMSNPYKFFWQ